jgi:hypothetical protein
MTAFSISLINKDPASIEDALEKVYLPALPMSALMYHKALVSQYASFAQNLKEGEQIKYFVKIGKNGDFLESLSIADGDETAMMISQCTPDQFQIESFKRDRLAFRPAPLAAMSLMEALATHERNVCYPGHKVGLFHTAAVVLMHIDRTHVYSVQCKPDEAFAIQGMGPDMETGPYFLIKSNSWANITLKNYARHNSPFHPNAQTEAVH